MSTVSHDQAFQRGGNVIIAVICKSRRQMPLTGFRNRESNKYMYSTVV